MNGLNQRTMDDGWRDLTSGSCSTRRSRPPLERSAPSDQRDSVGSAHGCAVAGFATAIRVVPDSASSLPKLGAFRGDRKSAADSGRAPAQGRQTRFEGMFCGRDLCSGQKRGLQVGKTKRGKGTKIMGIADSHGLPLALRTESASPAEVKLVEATMDERLVAAVPERLIGDKAYDSDRLDQQLMENYGTEMISPNRRGRRIETQDGRPLRRYLRRWKIERLFAWLFNFRRLVVRYEYHADNFQGFVHLGAIVILLRHL